VTQESDKGRIVAAATAVLPEIVATFEPHERPVNGGCVAFTVGSFAAMATSDGPPLYACWYVWRDGIPHELLDEAGYKERTRDPTTGALMAPTWAFHLAPIAADEWYFEHWFSAPLRMWLGEKAGAQVKEQGASFRARRTETGWEVEIDDVLAF
jgi:hypothetical protein